MAGGEARAEVMLGGFAPGAAPKLSAPIEVEGEVTHADSGTWRVRFGVEQPHSGLGVDADCVVQTELAHLVTKVAGASVRSIGEHNAAWDAITASAPDHVQSKLGLGLERKRVRNAGFFASSWVIGPRPRQIQLEIDRDVLVAGRDGQADADLAVRDLAGRTGVLPLHADRVGALLEKACVVDDPCLHRTSAGHRLQRITRRRTPNVAITPRRVGHEMQQPLVRRVGGRRIGASAARDRLRALALAVAENAHRIGREGLAAAWRSQNPSNLSEEPFEPLDNSRIHQRRHDQGRSRRDRTLQVFSMQSGQTIEMIYVYRTAWVHGL